MLAFQLITCKRYEFKGHIAIHCYICYMNKSEEEGVFATFRFAWVTMEGADHSCPALELTRVRTALYTQSLHFWRQAPLHILHSEFLTNCNRVREKKNCLYKACCCWFTATVRAWTCEFDCSVCLGLDAEHCQILYECHKSVFTSVFPRTPAGKGKCAWGTWLSLWSSNAWIASRKVTFGAAVPQRYLKLQLHGALSFRRRRMRPFEGCRVASRTFLLTFLWVWEGDFQGRVLLELLGAIGISGTKTVCCRRILEKKWFCEKKMGVKVFGVDAVDWIAMVFPLCYLLFFQ